MQTKESDPIIKLDVLYKGELQIESIRKDVTLIVGRTRVGKSCLYNHIRNKPMIGQIHEGYPVYVPCDNNSAEYALMSNDLQSLTLAPNICHLSESTSLIDMAGFQQNRNASGVMSVSYFLQVLFQKLDKVRFILTVNQGSIFNRKVDQLTSTFDHFIDLFTFSAMDTGTKNNLLGSVVMVVTQATRQPKDYLKQLQLTKKRLETSQGLRNIKYQALIVQILGVIIISQRIGLFRQAQEGQKTPQCQILGCLEQSGWHYFNLVQQALKFGSKDRMIILPFQRDFEKLTPQEQTALLVELEQRIQLFIRCFVELIRSFRQNLQQNWKKTIQLKEKEPKKTVDIIKAVIDNKQFMCSVLGMLSQIYSPYKINQLLEKIELGNPFRTPNVLLLIEATLKLNYQMTLGQNSNIKEKFKYLKSQLPLIVDQMATLCHTDSDYESMKKVAFVIKRTVHQFQIFYKIDQRLIHSFHFDLSDNIVTALNRPINYIEQVCQSIDEGIMSILFKTIPDLKKFQSFADKYINHIRNSEGEALRYKKDKPKIEMKHREISGYIQTSIFYMYANQQRNIEAITQLIIIIKQLLQTKHVIQELKLNSPEQKLQYQTEMKVIKFSKMLVSFLMKLPKNGSGSRTISAIEISELSRCPYETQLLYEQVVREEAENSQQLLKVLENYAQFLRKWGRIEDYLRVKLRQKHIYLSIQSFEKLQQIESQISQVLQNKQQICQKRNMLLTKLSSPFGLQEYSQLCQQLERISQNLLNKKTRNVVKQMQGIIFKLK